MVCRNAFSQVLPIDESYRRILYGLYWYELSLGNTVVVGIVGPFLPRLVRNDRRPLCSARNEDERYDVEARDKVPGVVSNVDPAKCLGRASVGIQRVKGVKQ